MSQRSQVSATTAYPWWKLDGMGNLSSKRIQAENLVIDVSHVNAHDERRFSTYIALRNTKTQNPRCLEQPQPMQSRIAKKQAALRGDLTQYCKRQATTYNETFGVVASCNKENPGVQQSS
jgi:hypothetical protein